MVRASRVASSSVARGSLLRKRVLGSETTHAGAVAFDADASSAVLGSAHANAYFNAKRLKQASVSTRKRRGSASASSATAEPEQEEEEDHETKPTPAKPTRAAVAFTVRPVSETAELLRRVDEREDAWRRRSPGHAWPTHNHLFPRWSSQLRAGFSVLLHGVGAKFELLQTFADTLPETDYVVHVHGDLPSVSLREVIDLLQDEVFALPAADAALLATLSFVQQCRALVDVAFAQRDAGIPHVYLVVHSLDGPALRDPELQAGLARLSMAPLVHLVASVDSVNAPALWAEDDVQRFRWVHHRTDTLRPHSRAIDLRLSREGKAAEQSISGVRYILQSLTPTDVGTLRLIAQLQLAADTTTTVTPTKTTTVKTKTKAAAPSAMDKYADYHAVFVSSRKLLLHATMQSLKNSIKCLEDNGLVRVLRVQNTEKLSIPLADELLQSEIIAPPKTSSTNSSRTKEGG